MNDDTVSWWCTGDVAGAVGGVQEAGVSTAVSTFFLPFSYVVHLFK